MNEQVGMNGEEGEGKSDNKKGGSWMNLWRIGTASARQAYGTNRDSKFQYEQKMDKIFRMEFTYAETQTWSA